MPSCSFSPINAYKAVWVKYDKPEDIRDLTDLRSHCLYTDKNSNMVFIPNTKYILQLAKEKCPNAQFLVSIEHNDQTMDMEAG